MASYRIGIDVGGTFTHAVALESGSMALVAQAKVPTTHRAARGVSEGVVEALRALLDAADFPPSAVSFVAYSTTQVTNALLEGDVAPVGIVGLGSGVEGRRARGETRLADIGLAPGRRLRVLHTFVDTAHLDEDSAGAAVRELREAGAEAVVAAEAFSVDDPTHERLVMAAAERQGLPATGTHEISGRYGLRVRTRTAVINASLLPKSIATADMTEQAVRESGIEAPLMVVRSDGGVMSVADMRRRPLLTLLSGPAAGVAAALMYARVSEGVFLEVGGTSTDITAIQHGRALLRSAEVGGHPLFLRTLDVRTIGVAGGSMPRVSAGRVHDVGPRSAHVAGFPYACFTPREALAGRKLRALLTSPVEGDPGDYVVLEAGTAGRLAVTLTCAANAAGRVPEGDFARADAESAAAGLSALGALLGQSAEEAAEAMLQAAASKASRAVEALLADRAMSAEVSELVAGGGGAGALAPAVGDRVKMPLRIAPNAAVVSAIGTALAVVRDTVERTVPNAAEADVLQIRREAAEAAVRAGADPDSVTVEVEYDARSAVLRAVATGHAELREREAGSALVGDEERRDAAAKSLRVAPEEAVAAAEGGGLRAYRAARERKRLFGLVTQRRESLALVDQQGVVRLVLPGGQASAATASQARERLVAMLDGFTRYGDAGAELPQVFLGVRGRVVNLSGLASAGQVLSLAEAELGAMADDEEVLIVAAPRG